MVIHLVLESCAVMAFSNSSMVPEVTNFHQISKLYRVVTHIAKKLVPYYLLFAKNMDYGRWNKISAVFLQIRMSYLGTVLKEPKCVCFRIDTTD